MILEDLHNRLEQSGIRTLDIYRELRLNGEAWRCQMWGGHLYGEGTGSTMAEAMEGALDDALIASFGER